jgi:hypothetical protein
MKGSDPERLDTVSYLAHAIPNDGAFWWYVGKDTPLGDDYMIQLRLQTLPTDPPKAEFLSSQFSVVNSTESAVPGADNPKTKFSGLYPNLSTVSTSILAGIFIGIAISYGVYLHFHSGVSGTMTGGNLARSESKPEGQTSAVMAVNESASKRYSKIPTSRPLRAGTEKDE